MEAPAEKKLKAMKQTSLLNHFTRTSTDSHHGDQTRGQTEQDMASFSGSSAHEAVPEVDIQEPRQNESEIMSDIAKVAPLSVRQSLSDADKYKMLINHFKPRRDFDFPPRVEYGKNRKFMYAWLEKYSWLCYSVDSNGGFCLPCMLFGQGQDGRDLGMLVSRPLTLFTKAITKLTEHDEKESHKNAITRAASFVSVMSGKQDDISGQLDKALRDRIKQNRRKLEPIIDTVLLCGRQNIPLRGHRDSSVDVEADPTDSENHGNFRALLAYAIKRGDSVLKQHLQTAPANATYVSSIIQNELINIIGNYIRKQILDRVKQAKFYTVIADEVTDCSNKEQLSLVLRYVDPVTKVPREDLVDFKEMERVTGSDIAEAITRSISDMGLQLNLMRGQCYDGASNMAGTVNGAAAIITQTYPKALYLHCASHCLNLVVVQSLQNTLVRNMMGFVGRTGQFFDAHPKRQNALDRSIDDTQPESEKRKLRDLCRTRWVERLDALKTFKDLHPSVVDCMTRIGDGGPREWSTDSLTDARGILLCITSTEFICALVITNHCLGYLKALTSNLQREAQDIIDAVKEVDKVAAALQDTRDNIDTHHNTWYDEVVTMCESVGVAPSIPRRCGRQRHRDNVPADTPLEYYKRAITIPLLDHLLTEMKGRFTPHSRQSLQGLTLVPSVLVSVPREEAISKINRLAEFYMEDLPSPGSVNSEIHTWLVHWQNQNEQYGPDCLPTSPSAALPHTTCIFPNIKVLLGILCTLPVTSCSAERSFSGLKRIKLPSRSTMTNNRLSSLTLMHVHRDIPVDPEEIINEFARCNPRKMQLAHMLSDSRESDAGL